MIPIFSVTLLCLAAAASAFHDGLWKGEGLAQSQWHGEGHPHGQWQGQGLHVSQWHDHSGLHKYGPAPLAHDGRVVDTPEVAHARAAHLQAFHGAAHGGLYGGGQAAAGYGGGYGDGYGGGYGGGYEQAGHGKWHGPAAHVELTHDGKFLKDTPEVAHAKAQHFAAIAAASHGQGHGYGPAYGHGAY